MTAGIHIRHDHDGDGNRLEKSNGKIYWYGAGTEILDESDLSGNFTNEYVFFGGRRIAIRNVSSGTIDYYEEDMLGSSRTLVQAGGTSPCFDADFLPFGYEKDVTTTCTQNYKFEGKERDTETSNDDFGARYYTFRLGRWLSADWSSVPAPVPYANLTNPQTLNLYAMVSDNPESFADLAGHCGTGAPSEPCHDVLGHGPASVEGEPGSSGIVNASCSLESCETAAEASAQQTQIAAQEAAAQNQMSLSAKGLNFIKQHEGYSDTVYNDSAGNPTIGYGHLIKKGENFDNGITEKEATALLAQDVKSAVSTVNNNLKVNVSQTKFDALVDFAYNLGAKNVAKSSRTDSSLISNINAGKAVTRENFTDWNRAGGKVVRGLTIRRTDEYNLFSSGTYGGP